MHSRGDLRAEILLEPGLISAVDVYIINLHVVLQDANADVVTLRNLIGQVMVKHGQEIVIGILITAWLDQVFRVVSEGPKILLYYLH